MILLIFIYEVSNSDSNFLFPFRIFFSIALNIGVFSKNTSFKCYLKGIIIFYLFYTYIYFLQLLFSPSHSHHSKLLT